MEQEKEMNIKEAISQRHSVRQYQDRPITEEVRTELEKVIAECNRESGLKMQLILNDPECFDTLLGHYGKFTNANNYIAVVGSKEFKDLERRAGYYGQRVVLEAQKMGLNTCWVAGTYGKGKCKADKNAGEKILCVIAVGYGENSGKKHRSKPLEKLCGVPKEEMPKWFEDGMKAAMMAPTAVNQQKFYIYLEDGEAVIAAKSGMLTQLDQGIVRYNFEAASGHSCKEKREVSFWRWSYKPEISYLDYE